MDDKFERFKNGPNKIIKKTLVRFMKDLSVAYFSEDSEPCMLGQWATTRGIKYTALVLILRSDTVGHHTREEISLGEI